MASLSFIDFLRTYCLANSAKALTKENSQMTYYYFKDHKGEWRWFLKAGNGRVIAASGEAYEVEQECLYDIELVKGSSSSRVKNNELAAI